VSYGDATLRVQSVLTSKKAFLTPKWRTLQWKTMYFMKYIERTTLKYIYET